ncbi:MAG: 30S ribosomal protein S16 [Patescibacteria group bacterium]|nr:30S ribosomal protein S16 [Patescibacteria group bacterium]
MLVIRFQPVGKKHQKIFRIVLQERRSKLLGKIIEKLGWWNPRKKIGQFNEDLINFYLRNGAQVSDSVWNLLIKKNVIKGKKRKISIKKSKKENESS